MKKLNLRMLSQYPEWHDKPLRLTTAEMNDPHLVLEDFFQAYCLSDTRASLKELLEDALSAEDVSPMSHLHLYDHVEKLIEAAFLIHQKKESAPEEEPGPAYETTRDEAEENIGSQLEGNPYSKPKRLMDKVKTDPMHGLKEIFSLVDLEELTQHLHSWVKVALLSEQSNYEQASDRAALISFSEGFLPLMEALYLKSEVARLQQTSGWQDELPRRLRRELERTAHLTYLTEEQINHPTKVLEAFCNRFSLPYGRAELWDLLDGVISYEGDDVEESTEKGNLLLYYDCFSALLEAAYRLKIAPGSQAPKPFTQLLFNLKIRTMALANYSFGPGSRDITLIEHYHEAPSLEPVLKRYIAFSEERNQHIRTQLSQLEWGDVPEKKQHIIAALASIQSGHEQDLTLFKNLLDKP